MMGKTEFSEKFAMLKDDELRKIVYLDYQEYEQNALSEAINELCTRKSGYVWENNHVHLKDLISLSDFDEVINQLIKLFPDEKKKIHHYIDVLSYLSKCKISPQNEMHIIIEEIKVGFFNKSWRVYAIENNSSEKISLDFYSWKEWVSLLVTNEQLQKLGIEVYVAYCLKAMTLMGFTEEEIDEKYQLTIYSDDTEFIKDEVYDSLKVDNNNTFIIDGIWKLREIKNEYDTCENEGTIRSHPWIRYFARTVDYFIWINFLYYISLIFIPNTYSWLRTFLYGLFLGVLQYFIWAFVEAYLISKTSSTFGKWILNIKVTKNDGRKLNYHESVNRALKVWFYGYGAGISFFDIVANIFAYNRIRKNDIAKWDEEGDLIVSHGEISKLRILITAIFLVVLPIILSMLRGRNIIL